MSDVDTARRPPLDLKTLIAEAESIAAAAQAMGAPSIASFEDLTSSLRTRLAVRGWVNPHRLLADEPPEEVSRALHAIAAEADSAFRLHPGDWYLSVASRKRVLATRGAALLKEELNNPRHEEDAQDSTRAAFRLALGLDPMPSLGSVPDEVLRALANVLDWLGPMAAVSIDRARITAELAARIHRSDLERMTALPMVGEEHREALAALIHRLGRPLGHGLEVTYIHGSGGAGKSTLLAYLQRDLAEQGRPAIVVRIDFDDPAINALDQASLDLVLFEQIGQLLPEMIPQFAVPADQLRNQRRHLREDPNLGAGDGTPRRKRAAITSQVASLASESADTGARSERQSIVHGLLDPGSSPALARPLIVILDTAELVMTQGDAAIIELVGWIHSLHFVMSAKAVRIVIAGRDPPAGAGSNDLLEQLRAEGIHLHPPIALSDLSEEEAAQLLAHSGVDDPATARAAAAAVPRNPLLLRITADALQSDSALAAEVRAAHANARIDAPSANTYLARRIVAHLADPLARPYLLAAMYLPSITRPQLRDIVIPVVDRKDGPLRPRAASRIFASLRSARWLSRAGADRRHFVFHRDVRALVLKLLAADPAHRELERKLRRRAIAVHDARRWARDRAYAIYHRALLGEPIGVLRHPATIARHLRDVLDELPPDLRSRLLARRDALPTAPTAGAAPPPDDEWRLYLEGEGSKDGEGARLLKRDRVAEALALYRDRPTRPHGMPPTFVLRALADTGEWDTGEVDIPAILEESRWWLAAKRLSGQAMSRLYWLTRFALVRDKARLSDAHADLLEACCRLVTGEALSTLPALVAVAEAGLDRTIMPPRMRSGRGTIESATRVHLIDVRRARRPLMFKPHVNAIAVIQRDWAHRVRREARAMVGEQELSWVQKALDDLDGQPVAAMNPMLHTLRRPLTVRWDGEDLAAGILVLRGETTEFLRPVRQALLDLSSEAPDFGVLKDIARTLTGRMSILPEELNHEIFMQRLEHDPAAWIAAFVAFADRSRLLPHLCDRLATLSGSSAAIRKARRVAESFRSWDLAICGGGRTSGW